MPREIPKDHPSLDLKKSLEFVFSNLEKGVTERGHHFHLLVLGTIDKDNKPKWSPSNTREVTEENIDKFSKTIQEAGFLSLFRRSRGRDINASCGSLANSKAILNE